MKNWMIPLAVAAATLGAGAAWAGDAAKGENIFKRCKSCHAITAHDGTAIVKGGKTGPDLYGIVGRGVAADEAFKYSESLAAAGAAGAVWDEASLAAYVADPGAWLKETLGDSSAKSKMTFKLKKGGEDLAAYLATLTD
ncbi:c-type cytochrome [Pseudooceanicola sp.]|uniref:c-type cytochrome n=1 Tax=Pseudooceanicola sp. TaxID=1914328 RepID=UPI0035C6DBB2